MDPLEALNDQIYAIEPKQQNKIYLKTRVLKKMKWLAVDRCKDPKNCTLVENSCSIRHNKMADQIISLTHLPAMAVI